MEQTYRSHIFDHLGLVAGMVDELGMGDVIDKATQQHPELRDLTVGEAVKAMVLSGLGCIHQARYLVPRCFQNKPTSRLMAPRVAPEQLHDDALGRALDTLDDNGVTALYRLMAAAAAMRLGWAPTFAHLDSPSLHVDGRYNSEEELNAEVMHITRGYSQDHRPDLHHVMLELMVEHQAGIPVLMPPLSGHSRDAHAFGQMVKDPMAQWPTPYGTTYLVADRALSTADNLQKLAETQITWMTRVPATVSDAQAALTQAKPQTMAPLTAGYRDHGLTSTSGGVA
jgi:transposase